MPYTARKIYLHCDARVLTAWANFMQSHLADILQAMAQEGVRHETWFSGNDSMGLFIIGVMETDDTEKSRRMAAESLLQVDRVHRAFKKHWGTSLALTIDPACMPEFPDCLLLFDVTHDKSGRNGV